ncbi:hypothetical protein NDU88_003544 [Pleurodeles waltl]|uniref:Uncharacterized protein n=1 Tax=Pleurodeles waltl TaxID=8319 RepID=A0AAV7RIV3_PLEWA|nr:hypothetical protein NDU88_003544 [Pleurodeles waltl]
MSSTSPAATEPRRRRPRPRPRVPTASGDPGAACADDAGAAPELRSTAAASESGRGGRSLLGLAEGEVATATAALEPGQQQRRRLTQEQPPPPAPAPGLHRPEPRPAPGGISAHPPGTASLLRTNIVCYVRNLCALDSTLVSVLHETCPSYVQTHPSTTRLSKYREKSVKPGRAVFISQTPMNVHFFATFLFCKKIIQY